MKAVFMMRRVNAFFSALDERLSRFRLLIGAAFALLLAGGFALLSVGHGPLYNLNDIGGFDNRAVFIALAAAGYALVLLLTAVLHRGSVYRLLLRQLIVTAGLLILLTGINQKTYFYVENTQPLIRAMDASGLSALAGWETNLSAPAVSLLYLITRGPVYDMYSVKLVCVVSFMVLCVLAAYAGDRSGMGYRAEALLALCLLLPSGFMSAACTALVDVVGLALLAAALVMALQKKECRVMKWASAALYGLALCISGLALYALPVFVWLVMKKRMAAQQLAVSFVIAIAACVPAIASGVPAGEALLSLLDANLALPEYAAGAPNALSMIPRALVSEMPAMFQLQHLPAIDTETFSQPFYTQDHFEQVALGFTLCGVAVYGGVLALLAHRKDMSGTARVMAGALTALIVCPGATNAAWIAAGVISLYAALKEKKLRLPACLVLFATSGAAAYPMLEEVLLPMVLAFGLCLCALLMTLDVIPTTIRPEENDG